MSKKLTPLQALNKIANIEMKEQYKVDKGGFVYRVVNDECPKELKIIEKALKALEVLKECFDFEGFDEFIPNGKWFEKDIQEREKLLKEMTK